MTIDSNNNNFNYLTDPTFTKVNRFLFCRLKKMMKEIVEILFDIIIYKTSK